MDIALLNQKITFQTGQVTMDASANRTRTWADVYTCFATISGEGGKEVLDAGEIKANIDISFTVRYCSNTASVKADTHRIKYGNDYYNIVSIDHLNMKKKCIKFNCKKE